MERCGNAKVSIEKDDFSASERCYSDLDISASLGERQPHGSGGRVGGAGGTCGVGEDW